MLKIGATRHGLPDSIFDRGRNLRKLGILLQLVDGQKGGKQGVVGGVESLRRNTWLAPRERSEAGQGSQLTHDISVVRGRAAVTPPRAIPTKTPFRAGVSLHV